MPPTTYCLLKAPTASFHTTSAYMFGPSLPLYILRKVLGLRTRTHVDTGRKRRSTIFFLAAGQRMQRDKDLGAAVRDKGRWSFIY